VKEIVFTNSDARGRNGWFKMAAAGLYIGHDGRLNVNITSKRGVCPGPVFLELNVKDALTLARELNCLARSARGGSARAIAGWQSVAERQPLALTKLRGRRA
jgi:hypothetical protein